MINRMNTVSVRDAYLFIQGKFAVLCLSTAGRPAESWWLPRKSGICEIVAEGQIGISWARRERGGRAFMHYHVYFSQQLQGVIMIDFHFTVWKKMVVWRSLSTSSKFLELAGGRASISTFPNPKPTTLVTSLCCLYPGRTQMIIVVP